MILIISFIIGFILSQFLYPASDKHEWKWFLLISTLFTPVSGLPPGRPAAGDNQGAGDFCPGG